MTRESKAQHEVNRALREANGVVGHARDKLLGMLVVEIAALIDQLQRPK